VDGIAVPARGSVALEPGGLHVKLIGLTRELEPGTEVALTLHFAEAGDVPVTAAVREQ
jgi:copper(I)-binding protein